MHARWEKGSQRSHPKRASHDWVTQPIQVVTTSIMGTISSTSSGSSSYLARFTDINLRFSALYLIKNKSSSSILDSLVKFEI